MKLKGFHIVAFLGIATLLPASCKGTQQDSNDVANQNEYSLVWEDEFNGEGKPEPSKWNYDIGLLYNQELQYYTDNLSNAYQEDGNLIIEARKEQVKNPDFRSDTVHRLRYSKRFADYTSARLTTKGLAGWTYGKFVIRAQLPKGVGLWPAIWMLADDKEGKGWPRAGEIDIMEHVGFKPDSIFGTVHTETFNHMKGTQQGKDVFIDKPYSTFHDYAIEWTPEKIDFLLDGVVYNSFLNRHKTEEEWPFDKPFHLILNVAVGGMLGGQQGVDDFVFPVQMKVDYVRIYQRN